MLMASSNVRSAAPGFVQRTYVVGGRSYVRVYRNFNYRGIVYQRYVPAFYFGPRFYFWAHNPWAAPVYWRWGWGQPVVVLRRLFRARSVLSQRVSLADGLRDRRDLARSDDAQQSANSDAPPTCAAARFRPA